jgi:itaconate CoA-transferase
LAREQNTPLSGLLVIGLEQAVAAPLCTCRLADAGARVIKIERPEGDFAREYDHLVHGESAYFVWLNRGKQSLTADLKDPGDMALLLRMIRKADVLVQNFKPGALERLGLTAERLASLNPRLVVCNITGYGASGPMAERKAYDLLIQAESGLSSVTGSKAEPGRVGVSICDIATGMYAYQAILEALLRRGVTGKGSVIDVSMFDAMADFMTVPLLQSDYGGKPVERVGLRHPSIAPYGVFRTVDGAQILISIQNEREWAGFCKHVLGEERFATDPLFSPNTARVKHREAVDGMIEGLFAAVPAAKLAERLTRADVAFATLNGVDGLSRHPHLRRMQIDAPTGPVRMPAPPAQHRGTRRDLGAVPALGQHSEAIRQEFAD